MNKLFAAGLALLLSTSAAAQTFPFAGALDDGDRPADGLFTFELSLLGPADVVLWSEEQVNVVVADGVFAIDVGANTPLPPTIVGTARLAVTIDGDALPPVPLARMVAANRVARATASTTASTTSLLGGRSAADVVTRESLIAVGGQPVAFANITGVPASVLDGDQGTDVTATSVDFAISARTLSLATVNGSRLAQSAVNGMSGTLNSGQVADGAVTGAKVADGSLGRAQLEADLTAREVKTANVFLVPAGCEFPGRFTTASSCLRRSCTTPSNQPGLLTCNASSCEVLSGIQLLQQSCLFFNASGQLVTE